MALVPSLPTSASGGAGGYRIEGPVRLTLTAGDWYELVERDGDRVYILVWDSPLMSDTVVSPGGTAAGYGWHIPTDTHTLLLHTASYPGLVGGEMYIRSESGGDVYVLTAHPLS